MIKIKTDLIHFGYVNKNGHRYEEDNINLDELNSKKILGEIHPNDNDIHLDRVSHMITNLVIEKGILYGDIEVLKTASGYLLEQYILNNMVVFRPRGTGIMSKDGIIRDYNIITFDALAKEYDTFDISMLRKSKIDRILIKLNKVDINETKS